MILLRAFLAVFSAAVMSCGITSNTQAAWKAVSPPGYSGSTFTGIWQPQPGLRFISSSNGVIIQNNGTKWTALQSPTNQNLTGVWGQVYQNNGTSAAKVNLYAVGSQGAMLHYNASGWQWQNNATVLKLNSVWGPANQSPPGPAVVAAGQDGIFVNNLMGQNNWHQVFDINGVNFQGLSGNSPQNVLAGSGGGILWSGSGNQLGSWVPFFTNGNQDITAIWNDDTGAYYAVGSSGLVLHGNGSTWQNMSTPTNRTLRAVWGTSASNVYAVGDQGTILRFNGTAWNLETSNTTQDLLAVCGSSASDVTVVGASGTVLNNGNALNHATLSAALAILLGQ
ncbi:WD40/YVTN/BNR-like repeat-containing protein [Fundidesulfovibrio soli]|uniref:WD40/YVTN/BNR-like repeat-containing protein n=1 Tax=Fundidesulfovibrio soli TaxID=2922716 RepID=UPI001FAEAD0C|nr:hypothetical protein [Fundidesulfovibrio soli]